METSQTLLGLSTAIKGPTEKQYRAKEQLAHKARSLQEYVFPFKLIKIDDVLLIREPRQRREGVSQLEDWHLILDPQTMKETRYQRKEASSTGIAHLSFFRLLLWAAVASIILASAVGVLYWRRNSMTNTSDPYATVPFRPKVVYDSSDVTISNTEDKPYFDTSLNIYVEATRYSLQIGTIGPGETVRRSLRSLTNERGESFNPGLSRTSELEVRARFGGYDVHKDFPPPR